MRRLIIFAVLVAAAVTFAVSVRAAREPILTPVKSESQELIVLEIEACAVCELVRTQIAPVYARTPRAQDIPMRFVDLNRIDQTKMRLNEPITVVPTIVLMRNGVEVDRITGYFGPDNFLRMVRTLVGPTD